jgi:phenylacetate-CoA oxygenase PaaJ subunit
MRREPEPSIDQVMKTISLVRDPELPMSVVDMGLIYNVAVDDRAVTVDMTLTSMGCPCHDLIQDDVRDHVAQMPGVDRVEVNIVWDPPWTRARITPSGRKALANWGIKS